VWLMPIPEPAGGVKAKHLIQFLARPVAGVLGANTTALQATSCFIEFAERGAGFVIAQGDTFAQMATKAAAALALIDALPVVATAVGDTLEAVDRHGGDHGNDMPVRVWFSNPDAGVAASPGTLTFAGTAGATGKFTVNLNTRPAVLDVTSGDAATVSAAALRTLINSDAYCFGAACANPVTGVVTLFYEDDRVGHRISTSVSGVTVQTLTPAIGVVGTGVPSLTAALLNLTADEQAYKVWSVFVTDTANWSALATQVIGQAETPIEKDQTVHGCLTTPIFEVATQNLVAATSPKLTSDDRFALLWQQGATVRNFEMSARTAAAVAAEPFANKNFNGLELTGSLRAPIGVPHRADRPKIDELNQAIATYKLAPIGVNAAGNNAVVRSSTTYKAKGDVDEKREKWSYVLTIDKYRRDLRAVLQSFLDKNIKTSGPPRTDEAVSPEGVKDAVYLLLLSWDAQDLFDGAEQMRDAVQTGVKVSPTRIDVALPFRPLGDLDQIAIVGQRN
jgi:phage tail sheath gpL-like